MQIKNIFVRELVSLLGTYGKELSNLFGLRSPTYQVYPSKVVRLKRSLTEDITATLNAEELDLLVQWLKLRPNGKEIRRLRAALLAETVRHMLGQRMDVAVADQLGEVVFQLLIGTDPRRLLVQRTQLLSGVRGFDDEEFPGLAVEDEEDEEDAGWRGGSYDEEALRGFGSALRGGPDDEEGEQVVSWGMTDEESERAGLVAESLHPTLEAAVEAYEQGALWLEVARDAGMRQDHLAQARALFGLARNLAADAVTAAPQTKQEQEWLAIIGAALKDFPDLP